LCWFVARKSAFKSALGMLGRVTCLSSQSFVG
jgi:hypothetical protein